jgi:cell division protein FtsQ
VSEGWFRRPAFFVVLVGLLVFCLVFVTTVSPLFNAKTINVEGESHLKEEKILALSGVDEGTNILWLSGDAVADRLIADPWVKTVEVAKRYPSTLTIAVTERTAVAQMGDGHDWILIAGDGTALEDSKRTPSLPEVQGVASPAVGSRDGSSVPAAQAIAAMTPSTREAVERVVIDDDGSLRMMLRDGGKVEYGPAAEVVAKAEAIGGVVTWAADNGAKIRSLDVTAPSAPAAKVTKPQSPAA